MPGSSSCCNHLHLICRRFLLMYIAPKHPRATFSPCVPRLRLGSKHSPPPSVFRTQLHSLPRLQALTTRTFHSAVVQEEPAAAAPDTAGGQMALLTQKLLREGIPSSLCKPGQHNGMICPKCSGGSSKEKSFSIFVHEEGLHAAWSCFRGTCGWKGCVKGYGVVDYESTVHPTKASSKSKTYRTITEEELELEPLCDEIISYFNGRMISTDTLRRNKIMQHKKFDQIAIAFTYRRNGKLVNCKYRDVDKRFWQEKDTEKILYGLDDIVRSDDIIIVEGEMDKLSMEEAGFPNCVSVPDGAPARVSEKDLPNKEEDTKFEYLWTCEEYLNKASRIVLATDADKPGQALAEELARRLGKERCWRVKWPNKNSNDVCKDANEVLMYLGPEALREVVRNAELYPIRGLFTFASFFREIDDYYNYNREYALGVSTGWRGLDAYYKVMPGELTIVTGVPNSGKSEWIDALLCNINKNYQWRFALCSMENQVREHARKLLEKHVQKPFFNARYADTFDRMSIQELEQGKRWLNETFFLIRCEDDCLPSIKWVLKLAKAAVLRYGVRGLVIDPYNELDHQRPTNQTETEYVSQMLSQIKCFAQHHSCHVWFVAHPKQLQNWNGGPPNMYDISGSAHFINKCDNGIVVHRNRDKEAGPLDRVQIFVRKVRNKVAGGIGDAFLQYNRVTGEYTDIDDYEERGDNIEFDS